MAELVEQLANRPGFDEKVWATGVTRIATAPHGGTIERNLPCPPNGCLGFLLAFLFLGFLLASQPQSFKVLAAIARAEENHQPKAIESKAIAVQAAKAQRAAPLATSAPAPARCDWRPLVSEALRLMNSVDETRPKHGNLQ